MIDKIKELLNKYREIILYIIFGVITTFSNWLTYAVMVRLFKVDLSTVKVEGNIVYAVFHGSSGKNITLLFIANLIAWAVGVVEVLVLSLFMH